MALLYRAVYSTPNRDKIIGTNIPCGHDVYKFFIIFIFTICLWFSLVVMSKLIIGNRQLLCFFKA
jgi:hypothetical protein